MSRVCIALAYGSDVNEDPINIRGFTVHHYRVMIRVLALATPPATPASDPRSPSLATPPAALVFNVTNHPPASI
jgi:hypothetical protein